MSLMSRILLVTLLIGLTGVAAGFESKTVYAICMLVGGIGFMLLGALEKEE